MTEKVNRIILIDFIISRNHSELYLNISRTSSERIEKSMSLLESLLIIRISTITDLSFIV